MMQYIQYLSTNTRGVLDDHLGSDGVAVLPGKCSRSECYELGRRIAAQRHAVAPRIAAMILMRGERFTTSRPIGPVIHLGKD